MPTLNSNSNSKKYRCGLFLFDNMNSDEILHRLKLLNFILLKKFISFNENEMAHKLTFMPNEILTITIIKPKNKTNILHFMCSKLLVFRQHVNGCYNIKKWAKLV